MTKTDRHCGFLIPVIQKPSSLNMKKILVASAILFCSIAGYNQSVYSIKGDSIRLARDSGNAELNLENSTRNVKGFLYNKGNGRTEFRRGLVKIDSVSNAYLIGADTLKIANGSAPAGSDTYIQYNSGNVFSADSGFRWKSTGHLAYLKKYQSLRLAPKLTATANNDTLITLTVNTKYDTLVYTGVKVYDLKINKGYLRLDSQFNFKVGNGGTGSPIQGYSNFFGFDAGKGDTGAYKSNFIGYNVGNGATNAYRSNFLGEGAGVSASEANNSNFIGALAGSQAINANNSNFFGSQAGWDANAADNSNFFGYWAGYNADVANNSNFLGYWAGYLATSANNSNIFGKFAGHSASGANNSNFFGLAAGSHGTNAAFSNFFGQYAGLNATNSSRSNFFGQNAGNAASDAPYSNFFGNSAGQSATNATSSNFFGNRAGYQATYASNSNFFGASAGNNAINASGSNFFGSSSGTSAIDAIGSNFLGSSAGYNAITAAHSNFFGGAAGRGASSASYSTFIGYRVGDSSGSFNILGTNNIIIGKNITTPTATTSNTFDFGNVLYGTNTYSTLSTAPSSVAQTNGQIGINVATPDANSVLDITSTSKGILPPRLNLAQRNAISSPSAGLTLFCTDCTANDSTTGVMQTYSGSAWKNYW